MKKSKLALFALITPLLLSACEGRDAIEFEVRDLIEADHWSRGDQKTCTVRFKILNNTSHNINKLSASMVWRDGYGDDVESLITMGELPSDEATRTGSTKTMYGRCSDLELIGIRKVLICDIDELTQEECIGKFKIIYRDGVGTIE